MAIRLFCVLSLVAMSACIPISVTDYEHPPTMAMRDQMQSGLVDRTYDALGPELVVVPDFERFAEHERNRNRLGVLRFAAKQPRAIEIESATLRDDATGITIDAELDGRSRVEMRVPPAYAYYPYDGVDFEHTEGRIVLFRLPDARLAAFGSPDRMTLDVRFRIAGEPGERRSTFSLERVEKTLWVTD